MAPSVFCTQAALDLPEERMWNLWLSRGGGGFQRLGLRPGLEDGGAAWTKCGTLRAGLCWGPGGLTGVLAAGRALWASPGGRCRGKAHSGGGAGGRGELGLVLNPSEVGSQRR